jgi:hypothetical protein
MAAGRREPSAPPSVKFLLYDSAAHLAVECRFDRRLARPGILFFFVEITVNHTISFRRPELHHVLSTMSVPHGADVAAQVRHLEDLGYKIVEVSPPLDGYGPPQNPHMRAPQMFAVGQAAAPFRSDVLG